MQAAELVRDYIGAWNRRDPTGIVNLLGQDAFYFDVPVNKKLSGEALVQYLARDFRQRHLHYDMVGEILMGNRTIAFQYKTYDVDDPVDAAAWVSGAEFLTVADDEVTGIDDYYKLPSDSGREGTRGADSSTGKYRKSGLSVERSDVYKRRLLLSMEAERLYRAENLTLPELAKTINCSINHLSQLINSEFDLTFYEFLNRYRIREAKALLARGSSKRQSIAQVAAKVGFRSNSAFYAAFRRNCQLTPSEYRRRSKFDSRFL